MQSIINPAKEKSIPGTLHYDFLKCSTTYVYRVAFIKKIILIRTYTCRVLKLRMLHDF